MTDERERLFTCKCLASRIRDWSQAEVKRRKAAGEKSVRIKDTDYFDPTYYDRHPALASASTEGASHATKGEGE